MIECCVYFVCGVVDYCGMEWLVGLVVGCIVCDVVYVIGCD